MSPLERKDGSGPVERLQVDPRAGQTTLAAPPVNLGRAGAYEGDSSGSPAASLARARRASYVMTA